MFTDRRTRKMPREDISVKTQAENGVMLPDPRATVHMRGYQELDLTRKEPPPDLSEGAGLIPKF